MKKIKEMINNIKNNKKINYILEEIKKIIHNENMNCKLRKIKSIILKTFFLIRYNWKKIVIGVFTFLTIAINTNIENIIKKLTIPQFIQDFADFLNDIFKLLTLNKIQVNSINILVYVLEIVLWCGIIYILDKYFRLKDKHQKELRKIKGFANAENKYTHLTKQKRNKQNFKILEETYYANGVPLDVWNEKRADIETATNRVIVDIKEVDGTKNKICVSSISPKYKVPKVIEWKDDFISSKNSVLVLGENILEKVTVDLNKTPHILLGGTTGSGKTILLENLIYQYYKKNAIIYLADLKKVDFMQWENVNNVNVITDIQTLRNKLYEVIDILINRQIKLQRLKVRNIDEYNQKYTNECNRPLQRIVVACDELTEIFNEDNKTTKEIEKYLSQIARLGRAFGITLIISTQRPDCKVLDGQIKSNIDVRICGKADKILSEVILGKGNTDADALIPKDAQGLFLTNNNKVFRGYFFPNNFIEKEKRGVSNNEYTSNN